MVCEILKVPQSICGSVDTASKVVLRFTLGYFGDTICVEPTWSILALGCFTEERIRREPECTLKTKKTYYGSIFNTAWPKWHHFTRTIGVEMICWSRCEKCCSIAGWQRSKIGAEGFACPEPRRCILRYCPFWFGILKYVSVLSIWEQRFMWAMQCDAF